MLSPLQSKHDKAPRIPSPGGNWPLSAVMQTSARGGVPLFLQAKLAISQPDDPAEQEADNLARDVVKGMSSPIMHTGRIHRQSVHRAMIQRTPAPPDYGGVTGVRDLSKLRIDPVPDIETSKFVAPLVVHAHVIDPAIAHLTWMLYDPKDEMIAGFSTLPTNEAYGCCIWGTGYAAKRHLSSRGDVSTVTACTDAVY